MNCSLDAWMAERCVRNQRIWGGLAALCKDFNRWRRRHRLDACTLDEFKNLFDHVIEIEGTMLIPGVGINVDWKVYANNKN